MVATTASSFLPAAAPARRSAGPVVLSLTLLAALLLLGDRLLGDPDTMWHVALGDSIGRSGTVPWADAYSHTFRGAPWIAKEWLSQLILAGAHAVLGWRGVVLVAAGTLALLFGLLFAWLDARMRATPALAVTLVAVLLVIPHILARPHVFALLALFLWVRSLVAATEAGRAPPLRALLIVAAWANLHGSVTFAYPVAGLLALEAVLAAPAGRRAALLRSWALFLGGAVLAGCVTPYGPHAMLVTATIFGSGESLPFVTEWQPLALDMQGIVALASAAAILAGLAHDPRRNAARIAILLMVTAMTVRHSRFLDLLAITAPLVAATPILRRFPALGERQPAGGRSGLGARIAAASLALVSALAFVGTAPTPPDRIAPAAALAAARGLNISGPVYNDYDFGGFLMREGVPTFIDGRTDQLFLGGFILGLHQAVASQDDAPFLSLLDRYGVTWALVRPDSAETRHLDAAPGWRRAYRDGVAAVFRRS